MSSDPVRRWSWLVLDDQETGSLEGGLAALFYSYRVGALVCPFAELLGDSLPDGHSYCGEEEWAQDRFGEIVGSRERRVARRALCQSDGRRPIVDVERSLAEAWRLCESLGADPPDVVLLDVRFDKSEDTEAEIRPLRKELESVLEEALDPVGFMERAGLYLFGKLLRAVSTPQRPLVVVYTANKQSTEWLWPFRLAFPDQLFFKLKTELQSEGGLQAVYRERLRQILRDPRMDLEAIERALKVARTLVGSTLADRLGWKRSGDPYRMQDILGIPVGRDWVFGTLFVLETPLLVGFERARVEAKQAIEAIEEIVNEFDYAHCAKRFFCDTVVRVLVHPTEPVRLPHTLPGLDASSPLRIESLQGHGALVVDALRAWSRLPLRLRETLDARVAEIAAAWRGKKGATPQERLYARTAEAIGSQGYRGVTGVMEDWLAAVGDVGFEGWLTRYRDASEGLGTAAAEMELVWRLEGVYKLLRCHTVTVGDWVAAAVAKAEAACPEWSLRPALIPVGDYQWDGRRYASRTGRPETAAFLPPSPDARGVDPLNLLTEAAVGLTRGLAEQGSQEQEQEVRWGVWGEANTTRVVLEFPGVHWVNLGSAPFSGGFHALVREQREWVRTLIRSGSTWRDPLREGTPADDGVRLVPDWSRTGGLEFHFLFAGEMRRKE